MYYAAHEVVLAFNRDEVTKMKEHFEAVLRVPIRK